MIENKFSNSLVYLIVLIFLFICGNCQAQKIDYQSPLNITLKLSGNFCEPRADHFHSGIDIKRFDY